MDEVKGILRRVLSEQFTGTAAQREYAIDCMIAELGLTQVDGSTINGKPVWVRVTTRTFYRDRGSRAYEKATVVVVDDPT